MKHRGLTVVAAVAIGLGLAFALFHYLYQGGAVPSGQPALLSLNGSNLPRLEDAFNHSDQSVRVLLMFSPT